MPPRVQSWLHLDSHVEMQRRVLDVVRGTLQRSARPVGSRNLRAWPSGVVSGDCLCAEAEGVADDADAR